MRLHFSSLFTAYATACLAGLAVDIAMLELLVAGGSGPHIARLVSILPATLMTFFLHSRFTFAAYKEARTAQGKPVPYGALAVASMILNYAVFTRVLRIPEPPVGIEGRTAAVVLGCVAAYGANWALLQSLLEKAQAAMTVTQLQSRRALLSLLIWLPVIFLALDSPELLAHFHAIMNFPGLTLPLNPPDTDAWLRLVQVRQWMTPAAGGDFFNHAVAGTNAPFGGVTTPWTRPLDALLALIALLLPTSQSLTVRLMLAATWLPGIMGLAALWFVQKAAKVHFRHVYVLAVAAVLFAAGGLDYFAAGDVDHHGLLSLLWCGVLWLLLAEKKAWLLGAFLGLMIWISPEGLLPAAFVAAVLGLEAIAAPAKAKRLCIVFSAAAALTTLALFVEMPAPEIATRITYDSLSLPQVALLWLTAAGAALMTALYCRASLSSKMRIGIAALCGLSVIAAQWLLYPLFFKGPMVMADPFVMQWMMPKIGEAKPLFLGAPLVILRTLAGPVAAAVLLALAFCSHRLRAPKQRFLLVTGAALGFTLLLVLVQIRWEYYLQPVAILVMAALLPGFATGGASWLFTWLKGAPRKTRAALLVGAAYLCLSLLAKALPVPATEKTWCLAQLRYVLQTGQLQPLLGDAPAVIFVPRDAGGEAQFFTPYHIIASNYHREGAGLRDIAGIEEAAIAQQARGLLQKRHVSALFTCPSLYNNDSWLSRLPQQALENWMIPQAGLKFFDMPGDKPVLYKLNP
ncbi:MAG: GtrA family protein [Micavibrio sp.]|nr:GtrA family protein [Micavibrio sp.]